MNRKSIVVTIMLVLLTMLGSIAQSPVDPDGPRKGPRQIFPVAPRAGTPRAMPANDDFANATVVALPLPYTDTVGDFDLVSPGETGEPDGCLNPDEGIASIWYSLTPAANMSITLDTDGSTFDTVLGVYTGLAVDTLTEQRCNDDFSIILDAGLTSRITALNVVAGTTYMIRVAAYDIGDVMAGDAATLTVKPTPVAGVFAVDTTADGVDAVIGDGSCAKAGGGCTLRAAINEANASQPGSTITLPAGTYTFTVDAPDDGFGNGLYEDAAINGDLDIITAVVITGAGSSNTVIDGADFDSVFEFFTGANVVMSGVTVRNGRRQGFAGGGLRINDTASVSLTDVWITGNEASYGAGITVRGGSLTMTNSAITANAAALDGGAIQVRDSVGDAVTISLTNVTISSNAAVSKGGGVYFGPPVANVTVSFKNVTIAANTAANGGGILTSAGINITVDNTLIGDNVAAANPDCSGAIGSTGFNAIGNATGCTTVAGDKINENVRLNALSINAPGQTPTHLPRLASPARDTGNPATCTVADQRGVDRLVSNAPCDIGALEASKLIPGAFSILTPATDSTFASSTGLTELTWQVSPSAYSYVVVIDNISSGTPVNTYTGTVPAAQVCAASCVLNFSQPLVDGFYRYQVTAYSDTNATAAAASHVFQVNSVVNLVNLLPNASFEAKGADKQPANWKVSNYEGDKRKCNKPEAVVAYDGDCAYLFKGSTKEKTALKSKQSLSDIDFTAGDVVRLTFYASPGTVDASAMLKIAYKNTSLPASKVKLAIPNGDKTYVPFSSEVQLVDNKITKAIVKFSNKSPNGKWYVDAVRMVHIAGNVRQEQSRGSAVLPPPSAPDGFRGQN